MTGKPNSVESGQDGAEKAAAGAGDSVGLASGIMGRIGWSSITEVLQLVSSAMAILILPRFIGAADYGVLSASLGVSAATASLSSFGTHIVLMKRVAQGYDLADAWARALSLGIVGPAVGSALAIGVLRPLYLPDVDPWVFGFLVASQVNFFWVGELATFIGVGTRRLKESAQIRLIVVACRVIALVGFALFGQGSLGVWAVAAFASFAVSAVGAVGYVWKVFGLVPVFNRISVADIREGLPFSVNSGSESLVDALDRPMLLHYGHGVSAGIYGLATRVIQFGYLPIRILLRASDADVFSAGKHGVASVWAVTRRKLLLSGIGVSVLVGFGFVVMSPLIPIVLGDSYQDSAVAIRWLAVLPGVRSIQYLMGNCLSAATHQWVRVRATMAAVVLNAGLNIWLLPTGTWRTAVGTTLVSEVFLATLLAVIVGILSYRERKGVAIQA